MSTLCSAEVITTGVIGGRAVRCLSVAEQIALHSGDAFRDIDHRDTAILSEMTRSDE